MEVDLDKLFSEIGDNNLSDTFKRYISSLETLYTNYTNQTENSLFRVYKIFDIANCENDDEKFISEALRVTNYDIASLKGEHVILFNQPVIVSSLRCLDVPQNENSGSVRLISFLGQDKKVISIREQYMGTKGIPFTKYKIYDVVIGLILPARSKFKSVECASFRSLTLEHKKIEKIHKALTIAEDAPKIIMNSIKSKVKGINQEIRISKEKFVSITGDIEALEQEKQHTEISLKSSKDSLSKVRNDLKTINSEYALFAKESTKLNDKLEALNSQLKFDEKLAQAEGSKLKSIKDETKVVNDSLLSVKRELADAKRENNLTTLDMVGHQRETNNQIFMYYVFAALVLIGLACTAVYIYINGEAFTYILPYLVDVSAWDILLSRLPLITATTIILGGLTGVFAYLIKHIVSLNTEKMTMLKAAILAEQISNSIVSEAMTDEENLEFKRDTKIKLIMQVFSKSEPELDKSNLVIETIKALNSK